MADKKAKRDAVVTKRARALAIMVLTRREDLDVHEADDPTLDLRVRLMGQGQEGVREWGVVVRGAWDSLSKQALTEQVQDILKTLRRGGPCSLPVCLFFFTMEDNQGWYAWVSQPVLVQGKAQLDPHVEPELQPIDKKALKQIVDAVDEWYEAFFANLIVNGKDKRWSKASAATADSD